MKVLKGVLFTLTREGRHTLQVPQFCIGSGEPEVEDIPDDWIMELKSDKTPCVGKEQGVLVYDQEGPGGEQGKIREGFVENRGTWSEFEKHVEEHFQKIEHKGAQKKKLAELKGVVI